MKSRRSIRSRCRSLSQPATGWRPAASPSPTSDTRPSAVASPPRRTGRSRTVTPSKRNASGIQRTLTPRSRPPRPLIWLEGCSSCLNVDDSLPRQRVRRVQPRVIVDGYSQSIHELAAEPGGHEGDRDSEQPKDEGQRVRQVLGPICPQQEAQREQADDDQISAPMGGPHPPCSRTARDREPVDQAEHGGKEPADEPDRQSPERECCEIAIAGRDVEDVEDHRGGQESKGVDDQHRVNGMSQELEAGLHGDLLSDGGDTTTLALVLARAIPSRAGP